MSSSLRILVLAESVELTEAICTALKTRGHETSTAGSVEEALAAATPDVLVAELDGSGMGALDGYARRGETPRIVFVHECPATADYRRAMRMGASDLLSLPFDPDELALCIENIDQDETRLGEFGHDATYTASTWTSHQAARDLAAYALRCGIGPATRARIATAAAEVLDNTWKHAYDGTAGNVRVRAYLDGRSLYVQIDDEGLGLDSFDTALNGMESEETGLSYVTRLCEEIHFDSASHRGTSVEMVFSAYRVHFDDECSVDLSDLDFLTPNTMRRVLYALEDSDEGFFQLSPALAVTVGRLLGAPDPRTALRSAFRKLA